MTSETRFGGMRFILKSFLFHFFVILCLSLSFSFNTGNFDKNNEYPKILSHSQYEKVIAHKRKSNVVTSAPNSSISESVTAETQKSLKTLNANIKKNKLDNKDKNSQKENILSIKKDNQVLSLPLSSANKEIKNIANEDVKTLKSENDVFVNQETRENVASELLNDVVDKSNQSDIKQEEYVSDVSSLKTDSSKEDAPVLEITSVDSEENHQSDSIFKDALNHVFNSSKVDKNLVLKQHISSQITKCWDQSKSAITFATKGCKVILDISFDEKGNVTNVIVINDQASYKKLGNYYDKMIDDAKKALYSCTPLVGVSEFDYSQWSRIKFYFYG